MSRSRIILSVLALLLLIIATLFLHREIMFARIGSLVQEEMKLVFAPQTWGQTVDGVQVSLSIVGIKEIQYSTGGGLWVGPLGKTSPIYPKCSYPAPGTKPHLLVRAFAKNVSDKIVYLIGDKTRSGIEGPAYLRVCLGQSGQISPPFKLHLDPFERQQAHELQPGEEAFYLEYVPYDNLASAPPGSGIIGMISIVNQKPDQGSVVQADAVAYSSPFPIPTHLFEHYFEAIR